jgi:FtsH-binding integral membrane protein
MSVSSAYAPAISGPSESRLAFLRKVSTWTFGGLVITAVVAVLSMFTLARLLDGIPYVGVGVVLGSFLFAQYVARAMVYGKTKTLGFVLGMVGEGIAFGFLLLSVVAQLGVQEGGVVLIQAMGLTTLAAGGMLAYVWFNKSDFSFIKAGLSVLFLPMLVLMAISWAFPIGGVFGMLITAAFVVFSGMALIYKFNVVVHEMNEDQTIEAAFEITMGILVLLWNLIVLLTKRR